MSTNTTAFGGMEPPPKPKKRYWKQVGGTFLILSVLAHILFFTGAAYYFIQIFSPKKLTFKGGVPSQNPSTKMEQHKVSMAKKRKSMSAPAPAKRVVSTGPAKITLPEMPALPTNVVTPTAITGIGGVGTGFGAGQGGDGNGNGGGGGFVAPFGSSTPKSGLLVGQYYDFKYTRSREPNKEIKYAEDILSFVKGGWHESKFQKYYKGPAKLYTTQIFFPEIDTSEGPKAFGNTIANNEGGKWIAVYRGMVTPPESGTYYFVGAGDDDMIVNFDGKEILNNCEHIDKDVEPTGDWNYAGMRNKFAKSQPVQVTAGQFYEIRILIGDDVPTKTMAMLLVMKDGVNYQSEGSAPIIPIFSVGAAGTTTQGPPTHLDGPVWRGKPSSTSMLDVLDPQ